MKMKGIAATICAAFLAGSAHAAHFGYEGAEAPEFWGDLSPDYAVCKTGKFQSPIDITNAIAARKHRKTYFYYGGEADSIVNNGHTIQLSFRPANVMLFEGKQYKLLQVHFHTPSEYTVNGRHYPMVAHLVHQRDDGQVLVVAVMFKEGWPNPVIEKIWRHAPEQAGPPDAKVAGMRFNVAQFVRGFRSYYRLAGSLTTPPCTEGVMWLVGKNPITASRAQIQRFTAIIGKNNRPVQPANGRPVLLSQ